MSELGFLFFGSADEVDPVEAAQLKASAVENVTRELDERGITAFALQADSAPEVEQRLLMREVNAAIDEIVERYLPEDDDAKKRVVSNIFRQFEAVKNRTAADIPAAEAKCESCGGVGYVEIKPEFWEGYSLPNAKPCPACKKSEAKKVVGAEERDSDAALDDYRERLAEADDEDLFEGQESRDCIDGNHADCENCSCGCHPGNPLTDEQAESYRGWDESRER